MMYDIQKQYMVESLFPEVPHDMESRISEATFAW
jgi:hypothetical protein